MLVILVGLLAIEARIAVVVSLVEGLMRRRLCHVIVGLLILLALGKVRIVVLALVPIRICLRLTLSAVIVNVISSLVQVGRGSWHVLDRLHRGSLGFRCSLSGLHCILLQFAQEFNVK